MYIFQWQNLILIRQRTNRIRLPAFVGVLCISTCASKALLSVCVDVCGWTSFCSMCAWQEYALQVSNG